MPTSICRPAAPGSSTRFPVPGWRDPLPIPKPSHPELTFKRVTTDEQLLVYADINSRAVTRKALHEA
ncbi:hypothetical protein AB0M48_32520 [Lentzea sp. NPDC051208]|uniref:hypothetical protein n=1 Tax=Lentzea sp. NPDC051208 TaxID=3154642 RepID=UPI003430056D